MGIKAIEIGTEEFSRKNRNIAIFYGMYNNLILKGMNIHQLLMWRVGGSWFIYIYINIIYIFTWRNLKFSDFTTDYHIEISWNHGWYHTVNPKDQPFVEDSVFWKLFGHPIGCPFFGGMWVTGGVCSFLDVSKTLQMRDMLLVSCIRVCFCKLQLLELFLRSRCGRILSPTLN